MDDDLFPSLDKNKDFIINNNHILEKLTGKKRKRIWMRVLNKKRLIINNRKKNKSGNEIMKQNSISNIKKKYINKNPNKFEIRKSKQEFDPTINYYIEYWKMFNENEYILAKIKENLYEINNMKGHLQELKAVNKDEH